MRRTLSCLILITLVGIPASLCAQEAATEAPIVPPGKGPTRVIRPFNGRDLDGWLGHIEKYWHVEEGEDGPEIVGRNTDEVPVSTYLLTSVDFSDFRFTFEFKLAESEMHSGVALWGRVAPDEGDEFTYAGHLVMFPSNYGFYDLYGRKLIHENAEAAKAVGHQHDWNKVEILAQGNRIRFALNGTLVSDWREPKPDRIKAAPIGLQLHSNKESQEVRFRNLLLETFPREGLVTVDEADVVIDTGPPERNVQPGAPEIWTPHIEAVIPDELLKRVINPGGGLTSMGFRKADTIPLYAILQKARELDIGTIRKTAAAFQQQRQNEAFDGRYKDVPQYDFPVIVDLFKDKEQDQNSPIYHGKLVTLRGHVRRLIRIPVRPDETPYDLDHYYEVWLYDRHAQENPVMILCTSLAEGLTAHEHGTDIQIDHCYATGYFFKNFGYKAQDSTRFAPVFIAQKLFYRPPESSGNPFALDLSAKMQLAIAAVVLLMAGRFGFNLWRKSRAEELQRQDVKKLVETSQDEPAFDNVVDTGGVLQLPSEMTQAADAAAVAESGEKTASESKTTSTPDAPDEPAGDDPKTGDTGSESSDGGAVVETETGAADTETPNSAATATPDASGEAAGDDPETGDSGSESSASVESVESETGHADAETPKSAATESADPSPDHSGASS
jgi:hypothetical protein